jgi:hypothetical protein
VGTHTLTEYLRFTSRGDGGDVNNVTVGFKLGGDDNSSAGPDGRLDICANDGAGAGNGYGLTPDRTIATFLGSGNVGIGTTNPSVFLHIVDPNVNSTTELLRLEKANANGDINNASIGYIGMHLQDSNAGGGEVARISYGHTGDNIQGSGTGQNPEGKGKLGFWTSDTGFADAVPVERMTINHKGNVGIGTASPEDNVHIYSSETGGTQLKIENASASGDTRAGLFLQTRSSNVFALQFTPSTEQIVFDNKGQGGYGFYQKNGGGTTNLSAVIDKDGNVGIGTTSPVSKLNVSLDSETGSSNTVGLTIQNYSSDYTQIAGGFGSRIQFKTNRGTSSTSTPASADIKGYIYSGAGGTGDYHALDLDVYGDNSSLNRGISILSQSSSGGPANTIMYGNVGIGTPSPGTKLHVQSVGTGTTVLITGPTQGNSGGPNNDPWTGLEFQRLGTNGETYNGSVNLRAYRWATSGQDPAMALRFNLSSTAPYNTADVMTLRSDGNVGIGTTSPSAKLDVVTSSTTPALWLRNSTNAAGCRVYMTDKSDNSQFGTLTYLHVDSSSLGAGNRLHFSTNQSKSVFSTEGTLMIGVDGKDNGYMTNAAGSGRKNLWIQSTHGGNTSQNYGWWIGAQNQTPSSSDNDLYFGVVRNGTITVPALIQDNRSQTEMNFTGQHRTFVKDTPTQQLQDKEGLIVSADQNDFIRMSGGVARGNEAITTNESLPIVSFSTKSNDKKCFGVVSTTEDPENRVEIHGNFASNMRKELGDTRVYINSVGEGAVWVTDINGPLESGDYITTSNVAGYGMRQEDDILHNYTVAKITMDCDFNPVTQPVQIIKKELANVDYWIDYATSEIKQEEYETLPENEREIREDKYYKIYKREIQKTNPENDKFVHEVYEELVNVLDEHGQLQWEDDPSGTTEKAYKIRYLDTDGNITDEANAVHIAAFVGCTYHCG